MYLSVIKRFSLSSVIILLMLSPSYGTGGDWYDHLNKKQEEVGKYRIFSRNDFLFCTGDDPAGSANNKAAELMLAGNFSEALLILEDGLLHDPLFLPFRYNAGICNLYLNRLSTALMHLTKAAQLAPEYSKIYLQTGYIYGRMNKESAALEQFRIALRKNPKELNTYILIGDIYFFRNQLSAAKKYYETTLTLQHSFPNGILGLAKIHFKNEEYLKAIVLLKSINLNEEYDKSYHYYFAECAYKIGDYATAADQYEKLIQFKHDRFFLTNSMLLMKHKLELAKRFSER
jgi:tetratricopeptide (TPR) repeat protein